MSKLSNNLRRLRTQKGVYLKELAPLLGVTVSNLSNYENGVYAPPLHALVELADYYGVSVDYLIGHTDCPCPISAINRDIHGGYTVGRFRELLDRLPEKELPYLVYMLKMFELRAAASAKRS